VGATPIDNNDADGKSGKLYGWLLIIRCTSVLESQASDFCGKEITALSPDFPYFHKTAIITTLIKRRQ
jgi:hypothetical protein